jgi:hypothetical protein
LHQLPWQLSLLPLLPQKAAGVRGGGVRGGGVQDRGHGQDGGSKDGAKTRGSRKSADMMHCRVLPMEEKMPLVVDSSSMGTIRAEDSGPDILQSRTRSGIPICRAEREGLLPPSCS